VTPTARRLALLVSLLLNLRARREDVEAARVAVVINRVLKAGGRPRPPAAAD
jgi:hypothetical protein